MLRIHVWLNEARSQLREEVRRHLRPDAMGGKWTVVTRRFKDWLGVGGRRDVMVDVVRTNRRTAWVRLPDGNIIKRKLRRDVAE